MALPGDRRLRILLVTPLEESTGPLTGTPQRLELIKRALRKIGDLTVFVVPPDEDNMTAAQLKEFNKHSLKVHHANLATAACRNLAAHKPSPKAQTLYQAQKPETYDVIFLHRLASAWWTGSIDPKRTLVDMDDIVTQYYAQGLHKGNILKRLAKRIRYEYMKRSEQRMLGCFRHVLVCSQTDKDYLNHPNVEVLINSYWPTPEMDIEPQIKPQGGILFVGTLGYPPNVQGMEWFVEQVLPRIRQRRSDTTVTVVGRCDPEVARTWAWTKQPGVDFKGSVPEVAPYIMNSQFEICPLLQGQGTRIKIVESLAYGKPVVSTTIGAYGIALGDDQGIIRRDDAESFAKSCLELLDQPERCHQLGLVGRKAVQENLGPAMIEKTLTRLIHGMTGQPA